MNRFGAASCAAAFFTLVAACGAEAQDPACGKNHYILDYSAAPWVATGHLNVARTSHTATLLPDGRVLIVGGYGTTPLDSAELYDPVTRNWSVTGSLVKPRVMHTATLLPNGKVLVVGGDTSPLSPDFGRGNTAELYDPATQTWTLTGSMGTTRAWHTATLLQDGRVLVAGGFNNDNVKTAELYDPATETWTPTGDLNMARYGHTATLLPDGSVLIAKGSDDGDLGSALWNAERYDPTSGTWSLIDDPTHYASVLHTATILSDGKVLFTGGYPGNGGDGDPTTLASSELFDPVTGTWQIAGNLNEARDGHTATLLPDGHLLVAGGFDWNIRLYDYNLSLYVGSAELYDPATSAWMAVASLGFARSGHTATLLPDGSVLVVGGEGPAGTLASAELYAAPISNGCQ